ncbi:MAG: hypothetical protein ACI94L_001487, partial [Flavobacteriaceae bacterium]
QETMGGDVSLMAAGTKRQDQLHAKTEGLSRRLHRLWLSVDEKLSDLQSRRHFG